MPQNRDHLPPGTLVDHYTISKKLGSGGFSLIYLAEDEDTSDEVVIKEYLPKKLATRDTSFKLVPLDERHRDNLNRGRKLFYQEARALASLRHPNIVGVINCFLANNTAYIVMEYQRGKNLGAYIKKRRGGLSTNFILTVFMPILDALDLIHSRSLLHLDIKPGNIHLRTGGDPLLLDFGAVHQFASTRSARPGQVITAGYSPVEQYYQGGYVGPWSDVYAIGASMRACIDGKTPPSAVDRHANDTLTPAADAFRDQYSPYLLEAIDWAMELDPLLRPQNAGELLKVLTERTGRPREPSRTKRPPRAR